jgi:hypothetical protein
MTCTDASTETYVAGDDFVWDYSLNEDLSDDDTSDWSDLLVEFRTGPATTFDLLATSEADGDVDTADTDYGAGRIAWSVPADVTAEWANLNVYMHVKVKIAGVETTVWPPAAFFVGPQVATRAVEGGS